MSLGDQCRANLPEGVSTSSGTFLEHTSPLTELPRGSNDTTTQRVENFLTSFQEASEAASALPVEPGFVPTRVARELFETFTYAQALPTMAVVTIVAGLGKTSAAEAFKSTRPHVFHVTLSPSTRTPNTVMVSIAKQLGIKTANSVELEMQIRLPDGPEKSAGLRKLLEAKDCMVRASLS